MIHTKESGFRENCITGVQTPEMLLSIEFQKFTGVIPTKISKLPPSGSYREYYRMIAENKSIIGVYNADRKENIAFIEFTKHFHNYKIPVPEILSENIDNNVYLLSDLGDEILYDCLSINRNGRDISPEVVDYYKKVIQELPKIQILAGNDLDYNLCYPRHSFDKQSMMWDLNYFKYYFLKFAKLVFDEQKLEDDFHTFSDYLLRAGCNFFLYRDLQSRNIMIKDKKAWFIDYQGGRRGALQYDIASLLFDAKADLPMDLREELLYFYIDEVKKYISIDEKQFIEYYYGYVLIRIMQAMGAFGFRGIYEKKEHFLKSIPFALENVRWCLDNVKLPIEIPTLWKALGDLTQSPEMQKYTSTDYKLTVSINSFSYRRGIPIDETGNGGGFVFDCRNLHNPGRFDQYKPFTGKDEPVQLFFAGIPSVSLFLNDIYMMIDRVVKRYQDNRYSNLMINFGCTGGQHRSVYCAEMTAKYLHENFNLKLLLRHREQELKQKADG